jgi:glycosyltransferase involved in cell wall biosynthesis
MAEKNINFEGFVSEERKRSLLAGAKAFVFNGRDEDFGIAPVEALAAGTPLLGVNEGMTQYQIFPGKNGYRHDRTTGTVGIQESVKQFERDGVEWSSHEISSFADRFSVSAFHERMHEAVADAVEYADTTPEWYKEYVS